MIAIFDAAYGESRAAAACVVAAAWEAAAPSAEHAIVQAAAAAYEPGAFYKRELPLLCAVLPSVPFHYAVVDGYVHVGPDQAPGLGAHLHAAMSGRAAVIGVAKTPFKETPAAQIVRGRGARPLYVTAIGVGLDEAARWVERMHGAGRIPTLIKRADAAARAALARGA